VNYSKIFCQLLILQATGERLGSLIQSLSSIGTGVLIAFIYSWEFALFILGIAPFFLIGSYLEMKLFAGFAATEALEEAGQVSHQLKLHNDLYRPVTRDFDILMHDCILV